MLCQNVLYVNTGYVLGTYQLFPVSDTPLQTSSTSKGQGKIFKKMASINYSNFQSQGLQNENFQMKFSMNHHLKQMTSNTKRVQ